MLFVHYSSAFNTIIPDILVKKLQDLDVPLSICPWIKDFLTDRPQVVRLGQPCSSTLTLWTWSHQGCELSSLLCALYTYDCAPIHASNTIKFANDTTVVGLITGVDESACREEIQEMDHS